MTVSKLKKLLEQIESKGNGRAQVCVDKGSLHDGNGTWGICEVNSAEVQVVNIVDGDGWMATRKDGSERTKTCLVICGS